MIMSDFRSRHPEDVQYMLRSVHGDILSEYSSTKLNSRVRIYGGISHNISKYSVSVPAPLSYCSDGIQRAVTILHCIAGSAEIRIGSDRIAIRPGQIIIIGSNTKYRITTGGSFCYSLTLILDNIVDIYCEKLIKKAMQDSVCFSSTIASEKFLSLWNSVSEEIDRLLTYGRAYPATIGSIVDYAVALLLELHPHNYSAGVFGGSLASPEVVREAKRFVEQNAHRAISVADMASFVGCGMRALHHGFCDHLGLPPRAFIYCEPRSSAGSRRGSAWTDGLATHNATAWGSARTGAGESLILRNGGDLPATTVATKFAAIDEPWIGRPRRSSGTLSSLKIDLLRHHINMSLGLPMTVCELSRMVGMSSRRFAAAFRKAFGASPAQYVIWERLKWTCWLLVNTNDSIASIASETGFKSQSYLTTALKGWNGQTPCELRKLSRSLNVHRDKLFCVNLSWATREPVLTLAPPARADRPEFEGVAHHVAQNSGLAQSWPRGRDPTNWDRRMHRPSCRRLRTSRM